jgi:aspartyl-tRNA(Asn)/glutamyl-tRNA(Gln) amidotransferase subunit C
MVHMSPKLSLEDVDKIAKLARLAMDPEEVVTAQHYLAEILGYVDTLANVPTDTVEPYTMSAVPLGLLRHDEAHEFEGQQTLLREKNFTKDHLLRTKAVFEDHEE